MGIELKSDKATEKKEWTKLLVYICAKKTGGDVFQVLFDHILSNENHLYYREARTLKMLYDFTPLRRFEP